MFILKLALRILLLPVLLVVFILRFVINILLHIGSLGVTGILLIGLYAIVTGIVNKNWQLTFIMSIASVMTIVLSLATGIIVALMEELTSRIIEFMVS